MGHASFDIAYPFIDNCSTTPRGTTPEFLICCRDSIVRGNAHPWSISLLMDLSSAYEFITEWDDLRFPNNYYTQLC